MLALSTSLSVAHLENTNGTVSADGRTATWKTPVMQLIETAPEKRSLVLNADVYFK